MRTRLLIGPLLLFALPGCNELYEALGSGGPNTLRGDDAFSHLAADRSQAVDTDLTSVMAVMDDQARLQAAQSPNYADDPDVIALRRRSIQSRLTIDESEFELVDFDEWGDDAWGVEGVQKQSCDLTLSTGDLFDEFLIPHVDKIPVRNQRARGTCAAFAGVGTVEYAALNPTDGEGGYNLDTLDLSEQRFYWLSKPDCRDANNNCGAGSWFGTGFNESSSSYSIPLEKDCPYVPFFEGNDTQAPQAKACSNGVARVDRIEGWCGLQSMVDLLHRGYAIPVGSPLSGNWERNEGLITKKDYSDGGSVHAGGHAYLIVGYRKLPDLPDEGGMCFVVKNSWGKGWGVNGYSCMTLAWVQAVGGDRFRQGFPVAVSVDLDEDALDIRNVPAPTPPPTPDPPAPVEPEEPEEPVEPLVWSGSNLRGPDDVLYRVDTAERDGDLFLRKTGSEGQPLALSRRGDAIFYENDEVGRADDGSLTVCTGQWEYLCALRVDPKDDRMFLQFRDDDLRRVRDDEVDGSKGEWQNLPLGGPGYGVFIPKEVDEGTALDPKVFVRVGSNEPLRLALRPQTSLDAFDIRLMGVNVGELNLFSPSDSALCSGKFAETCNLIGTGRLSLIPGNRRSGKRVRNED
jgi:hypothetical protein